MKHLLTIVLTAILCATATAQTIRTLGYNSTNGQVVANTGTNVLTFTNEVKFASGDIVIGVSSIYWIGNGAGINFEEARFILDDTNAYWTFNTPFTFQNTANAATTRANLGFSTNLNTLWTATNASNARSAVELGLPALTNTSNVTMMRALSGSTNTNQPYSGTVSVVGTNNTNVLVFSNGVLQEVQ